MLVGQVCVGHGAIEPHVGHRIARAFGPAAARPVARLGVVRRGRRVPADGRWCVSAGRASRGGRPAPGGPGPRAWVVGRARGLRARACGRLHPDDPAHPGAPTRARVPRGCGQAGLGAPRVWRAAAGSTRRCSRGPAGSCSKPLEVVAGGFLRPVFTIPRRLVGRGAGVTGRAWSCCDLARLVILRLVMRGRPAPAWWPASGRRLAREDRNGQTWGAPSG